MTLYEVHKILMHNSYHPQYVTANQIKMNMSTTQAQILGEMTEISEGVGTFYLLYFNLLHYFWQF
jgi:hypothetical protein